MSRIDSSLRATDILNFIENLDDDQKNRTAGYYLAKQRSYYAREKVLMKYRWGMGIEHETQFVFLNELEKQYNNYFLLMNFLPKVLAMLKSGLLSYDDYTFLKNIPFELTGRKCNKKYVMKPTPVEMPEFVTSDPFSDVIYGKRYVDEYYYELLEREAKFLKMMKNSRKKLGDFCVFPFGMSNNFKVLENYEKGSKISPKLYKDYTGSYHFTLTLPFIQKEKYTKKDEKDFLERHKNFALMFQWLEPLLCASFFSVDSDIIDDPKKRTHGSFRVLMTGWGNFGGSEVKQFDTGVGRYAVHPTYWRKNIKDSDYKDLKKLQRCDEVPHPREKQSVSMLSSNIRTFGATDPARPWHRESGAPMNIPNGLEFRIFDNFNSVLLIYLLRFIVFLAEHSTHHKCTINPYDDKDWKDMLKKVMKDGWKADISASFNKKIEKVMGLKIKNFKEMYSHKYLEAIMEKLYQKNKKGDIVYMMLKQESINLPNTLPNINKRSWQFAFNNKLLTDKNYYKNFEKMCQEFKKGVKDVDVLTVINKYYPKEFEVDVYSYLEDYNLIKLIKLNNNTYKLSMKPNFKDLLYENMKVEFFPYNLKLYDALLGESKMNKNTNSNIINKLYRDFEYFNTETKRDSLLNIFSP